MLLLISIILFGIKGTDRGSDRQRNRPSWTCVTGGSKEPSLMLTKGGSRRAKGAVPDGRCVAPGGPKEPSLMLEGGTVPDAHFSLASISPRIALMKS